MYSAIETFKVLNGSGLYWALVFAAVIFIYIENKKAKKIFFSYLVVLVVLFLNPIFDMFINKFEFLITTYYRTFWLIPIVVLIPYAATKAIVANKTNKDKIIISIMLILTIVMCGVSIRKTEGFKIARNEYKMPSELIEIIDVINEDTDEESPKVMFTPDHSIYARQYDANLQLVYGWSTMRGLVFSASLEYRDACRKLYLYASNQQEIVQQELKEAIEIADMDYIVAHAQSNIYQHIEKLDFEEIDYINDYYIIKR